MGTEQDPTKQRGDTLSTVDLTSRAATGDDAAFEGLYSRHYERVLRITALRVGRMLGNCRHEIEDAVQEAFAETLLRIRENAIPGIHAEHAFRRYIATAAANRVRSFRRKNDAKIRGGEHRQVQHESLFDLLGTNAPGPVTLQALKEMESRLEAELLALPEHYRLVLEMHCLQGMSYQEIAESGELRSGRGEVVGRVDMVRLMVHRARCKLEEAMSS